MKISIQEFLKEQKIDFYMGRVAEKSPYHLFTLVTLNPSIKLMLVTHSIDMSAVVIYWHSNLNYAIQSTSFTHYNEALPLLKAMVCTTTVNELIHEPPENLYLNLILTHSILKEMSFAQSMAKQFLERGKLSDKQLLYIVGPTPNGRPPIQSNVLNAINIFTAYAEKVIKEKGKQVSTIVTRNFNLKATKGDDVTLVPTTEYKSHQYTFPNFNPVQSLVFPHINSDNNLVIGANTSSGKTICAEMLMDGILANKKKIVYLSPLKSLTQEKYSDWQKRFPDKTIEIMTGDYNLSESQANKLKTVDIICMTSEMLDSRTRKFESEKNTWLYNVGLLIVDESHITGVEGRGPSCEVGIMRFTQINPDARVLLLSATMPNVEEFGEWLSILNGKKTDIVLCDWRPVVLKMHYIEYTTQGDYYDNRNAKMAEAVDLVLQKPEEKFLIFVHDKTTGREIIKLLKAKNVTAMFHNADLNITDRLKIEEQFKIKKGGLQTLVATSTLAWGVNLPARNVIIVGVHRGMNEVDELDIVQMLGRAGRYGIDTEGFVYMVLPERTIEKWKSRIRNPRAVTSCLKKLDVLAFHVLSEINTKNIINEANVKSWYSRSLASVQQIDMHEDESAHVIQDLINMKMVKRQKMGNMLNITNMGIVSALMYYNPYDIYDWYRNFEQINSKGSISDVAMAWAIADIPSNRLTYVPKNMIEKVAEYKKLLIANGIDMSYTDLTSINSIYAAYHCLQGSDPIDGMIKSTMRSFQYDAPRMISSLEMIDANYSRWGMDWNEIGTRAIYGVRKEMLNLVKIEGVGRARAEKLYSLGFTDAASLAKTDASKLQPAFTLKLAKEIIKNAQEINK